MIVLGFMFTPYAKTSVCMSSDFKPESKTIIKAFAANSTADDVYQYLLDNSNHPEELFAYICKQTSRFKELQNLEAYLLQETQLDPAGDMPQQLFLKKLCKHDSYLYSKVNHILLKYFS